MKDVPQKTIGVLGMACCFSDAPDLADFWYLCVNGQRPQREKSVALKPVTIRRVLGKTVYRAMADSGLADFGRDADGTRLLIFHENPMTDPEKKEALGEMEVPESAVTWHQGRDFGFSIIEKTLAVFENSQVNHGVCVVLGNRSGLEIAVMVVGVKRRNRPQKAYGQIQAPKKCSRKQFGKYLSDDCLQGLGYLGILSGQDSLLELADQVPPTGQSPEKQTIHHALVPYGLLPVVNNRSVDLCFMAVLMQCVLSLCNKIIPPSPGEHLAQWLDSAFYRNTRLRPWIQDARVLPRKAIAAKTEEADAVSFISLEEISLSDPEVGFFHRPIVTGVKSDAELIAFSAESLTDVIVQVEHLLSFVKTRQISLEDVAGYFSQRFSKSAPYRLCLVVEHMLSLRDALGLCLNRLNAPMPDFSGVENIYFTGTGHTRTGKLACLFPGMGFPGLVGRYVDHLMTLCLHFPEFRQVFDHVDLRDRHPEDSESLSRLLFPPDVLSHETKKGLRARMATPAILDFHENFDPAKRNLTYLGVTVANWAGWRLFQYLQISPDVLFGQSLGELTALCAGGAVDYDALIAVALKMSMDPRHYSNKGRLAVIAWRAENLEDLLKKYEDVAIAVHVTPDLQILGGEYGHLAALAAEIKAMGGRMQFLPYAAIHTPKLTALRPVMEPYLAQIDIRPAAIPVYSGMTCETYSGDMVTARKNMINNIDHPVFFWQTVCKMVEDGVGITAQVGGGASMYSLAETNIGEKDLFSVSLDVDYRSAMGQLHHLCAGLLEHGVAVDVGKLYAPRNFKTQTLSAYFSKLSGKTPRTPLAGVRMPFVGRIIQYIEGKEILTQRAIDLDTDLYVRDHLFVNARTVAPLCACLPVVPMTMSLEMMAETAACLAPGCGLVGFASVKAARWIGLTDTSSVMTQIHARCADHDPDSGVFRIEAAIFQEGEKKPAVEGVVLLSSRYHETLALEFLPITDPPRYPFDGAAAYEERYLFHGPMFQCMKGPVAVTGNKVMGQLEVLPKFAMVADLTDPEFLCDPTLLDGIGQLVGLWAVEKGAYAFPIGLEKLEIYRPTPAVGSRVPVVVEIKSHSAKLITADVEIQDGNQNVWMRIKNWRQFIFRWPKALYDFRRSPERHLVGRVFAEADIPDDALGIVVLPSDCKGVDMDMLCRFYCHEGEMAVYEAITGASAKRQWLMERIAVKDALRRRLAGPTENMLHPAGMILDESKKAFLRLKYPLVRPEVFVRMASSPEAAVAVSSFRGVQVDLHGILASFESTATSHHQETIPWH